MYTPAQIRRRKQRIRVLLSTMDEPYDVLSRQERDVTGFAEPKVRRYTCGRCAGKGCQWCRENKRQWAILDANVPHGMVAVLEGDPYDTGVKALREQQQEKVMSIREIDNALLRLRETELMRNDVITTIPWQSAFVRSFAHDLEGDFELLRRYLDIMPRWIRGEEAVLWLAVNMPGPIMVPRDAFEAEVEQLSYEIVDLREEAGLSVSEIADYLGVSQRRVKNALREAKKR